MTDRALPLSIESALSCRSEYLDQLEDAFVHERADAVSGLGKAVAARRKQLRLTQHEAAELAGIAVRSVHAIEAGKPTSRLDTLLALLAALGLELRLGRGNAPGALAVVAGLTDAPQRVRR